MVTGHNDDAEPIVVAAAIIERQGQYLIARRRDDADLGGLWEFPGGKLHDGETLEACLHRELKEELGVEVEIIGPERVMSHTYDYGRVELHFFRCSLARGEPRTFDCQELRWVSPAELLNYSFPEANRPLIKMLSRQL